MDVALLEAKHLVELWFHSFLFKALSTQNPLKNNDGREPRVVSNFLMNLSLSLKVGKR
jgi:hypothetical protein